jgi:predicted metalloprotease
MSTSSHRGLKAVVTTTIAAAGLTVLPGAVSPAAAAEQGPTMQAFLETELLDVHDYWTRYQTAVQGPATSVTYVFPTTDQVVGTLCQNSNNDSMFYCGDDDQIVFSQDLAVRLWNGAYQTNRADHTGKVAGDFAVALMVAHEYAHNVQHEKGILTAGYLSINTELHADCWAGVWMHDSWMAGELQGTDVEEATAVMERVGDDEAPYSHGTSEQRAYAFRYGYDAGTPDACQAILQGTWLQ